MASRSGSIMTRRLTHLVLGLAMAVFAVLQLNDVDPWLWVSLYAAAGLVLLAAVFGWYRRWCVLAVWVVYAVVGVTVMPGFFEWVFQHPWSDLVGAMSAGCGSTSGPLSSS